MGRTMFGLVVAAVAVSSAMAQLPYPASGPPNYTPYPASPQANAPVGRPPISPYLNLLYGNNPALNYYYGVRPLVSGSLTPNFAPQQNLLPAAPGGFFQPTRPLPPPYPEPDDRQRFTLPSPGGPVVFGNSFGSSRAGVTGGRTGYFSGAGGATASSNSSAAPLKGR